MTTIFGTVGLLTLAPRTAEEPARYALTDDRCGGSPGRWCGKPCSYRVEQRRVRERFLEQRGIEIFGDVADDRITTTGHQDDWGHAARAAQLAQDLEAAAVRHVHVGDDQIETRRRLRSRLAGADVAQELLAIGDHFDLEAIEAEQLGHHISCGRVVVGDDDAATDTR